MLRFPVNLGALTSSITPAQRPSPRLPVPAPPAQSRLRAQQIGHILVLGMPQKRVQVQREAALHPTFSQRLHDGFLEVMSLNVLGLLGGAIAFLLSLTFFLWMSGAASVPLMFTLLVSVAVGTPVLLGVATIVSMLKLLRDPIEGQLGWAKLKFGRDRIWLEGQTDQAFQRSNLWRIQRGPEQLIFSMRHHVITITAHPAELDWLVTVLEFTQEFKIECK